KTPGCFQAILLYCKALVCLGKEHIALGRNGSLKEKIIELILIILKKNEDFSNETCNDLYNIAHFLGSHALGIGIFKFLEDEMPFKINGLREIDFGKLSTL